MERKTHLPTIAEVLSEYAKRPEQKEARERWWKENANKLEGQRFFSLTCIAPAGRKQGRIAWLCRCDCGVEKVLGVNSLQSGNVASCGCARRNPRKSGYRGGETNCTEYIIWSGIKTRCLNPRSLPYPNYGGRGILICDRWKDDFKAFLTDMGRRPSPDHTLDRIDNDGNYEPGNCRWATRLEQTQNRRVTTWLTAAGRTKTAVEWAEELGVTAEYLRRRFSKPRPFDPFDDYVISKSLVSICG